ncbi:hypothetical protein ACEPPN_016853 [Leptodophora sp. 'Broadleaf-Isolate-01']
MPSTITPPSAPILGGAGRLVADCQPLLAVNTSPPPVRKSAARESGILVTREVEVKHEVGSVHEVKVNYEVNVRHEAEQEYDIDELLLTHPSNNWKLYYVAADEIKPTDSD